MPRDVDIGRELASLLSNETFSQPQTTEFRYDQFIENDRVDDIRIRIAPEEVEPIRHARGQGKFHRNAVLSCIMVAPAQANSDAAVDADVLLDGLLDLWDEVATFIQNQKPLGRSLLSMASFDDMRFDKDKLQNDRQFRTGYHLTYANIDDI